MEYDPKDVSIIVNGVYLTGLGEDMVTVAKDENNFEVRVGAQGDTQKIRTRNPLGTATATLMATSPQRPMMDRLANSGDDFSFTVIYNGEPKETTTSERAFIVKQPDREYAAEIADRGYEIKMLDMLME